MRLALAIAAVLVAAQAAPQADAQRGIVRFQTPSRNIGCLFWATATGDQRRPAPFLRCDILSGVKPAPAGVCQLDWTGFSMTAISRVRPTCAGDTVYARAAPVVSYGRTWTRGGFSCSVKRVGLRCTNVTGRGFFLSKSRSYGF
jgi:hypothetical protein